jgi:hypothetical protein
VKSLFEIRSYLEKVAFNHNVNVIWTDKLAPETPPGCSLHYRNIVMNLNWHRPAEISFQLAHEISHILNGDETDICFYHATFTGKHSVEYKANTGAVKLMVPFYCQGIPKETINVYDFMESYEVPSYLDNVVREEVHNYYISNRY